MLCLYFIYVLFLPSLLFFCCNCPAPTHIYTLSLHDALPILSRPRGTRRRRREGLPRPAGGASRPEDRVGGVLRAAAQDRKSTRLNSSHQIISYAVFCLKKKKTNDRYRRTDDYLETPERTQSI